MCHYDAFDFKNGYVADIQSLYLLVVIRFVDFYKDTRIVIRKIYCNFSWSMCQRKMKNTYVGFLRARVI